MSYKFPSHWRYPLAFNWYKIQADTSIKNTPINKTFYNSIALAHIGAHEPSLFYLVHARPGQPGYEDNVGGDRNDDERMQFDAMAMRRQRVITGRRVGHPVAITTETRN